MKNIIITISKMESVCKLLKIFLQEFLSKLFGGTVTNVVFLLEQIS